MSREKRLHIPVRMSIGHLEFLECKQRRRFAELVAFSSLSFSQLLILKMSFVYETILS